MKKENLFDYLEAQEHSILIKLLNAAFESMDTNQRHEVFGEIIKEIPPFPVNGEMLLGDVEVFHSSSMAGHYYGYFDINSKNFSDVPEETEKWFDEIPHQPRPPDGLTGSPLTVSGPVISLNFTAKCSPNCGMAFKFLFRWGRTCLEKTPPPT